MEIKVKGTRTELEVIGYRPMGFGQPILDRETYAYELSLSLAEFTRLVQTFFNTFVEENRLDDEQTDYKDAIPELQNHMYVDFNTMFSIDADAVCNLVREYLFLELLESVFGGYNPTQCVYSINTVCRVFIVNSRVYVTGHVFPVNV